MFRQGQRPTDAQCLPAGEGHRWGQIWDTCLSRAWILNLGSPASLPRVSPSGSPLRALPHHCSTVWGGTSQIRRNNGLGRGQVPLGAQQRAGTATTDSKTASTPPVVAALPPDSVSPALRAQQSRALLSWMHFPYVPGILISSSPGG